jgi:protein TonB
LRRADLVTAGLAVVVHAGIAIAVTRVGKQPPPPQRKTIVLQYEKKPEPPPAPEPERVLPAPAPVVRAPSPRKVAVRRAPAPARAAAATPAAAPAAAPMYAVSMTSTTQVGSAVAVPQGSGGGTGLTPSKGSGRTSAADGDGTGFRPASAREVGSMPEVDTVACGKAAVYPKEAERSGVEGDVRLRVALTDSGKVHDVRVLTSLGRGFDVAAVDAIKNRCRFKPAIGRDGQPVAFVIQSYTFHFELPR